MRGAMQYFECQMQKFPLEICISTRRDVSLPRDEMWIFTRHGIYTLWNGDISTRRARAH